MEWIQQPAETGKKLMLLICICVWMDIVSACGKGELELYYYRGMRVLCPITEGRTDKVYVCGWVQHENKYPIMLEQNNFIS